MTNTDVVTQTDLTAATAELAALQALTCTADAAAKTLTVNGTAGVVAATSAATSKATVAVNGTNTRQVDVALVDDGTSGITVTVTGTYFVGTFTTTATVSGTHTAVAFSAIEGPAITAKPSTP